jgi:hypothetical protein
VSNLRQRLASLEQALHPEGRLCAIVDDGSEDIEARIARCGAETGLSPRDLIVIVKRFCERAPREAQMRPLVGLRPGARSRQRTPMARRKGIANVLPHP